MFKSNIIYLFSFLLLGRFHRLRINEDKNKSALERYKKNTDHILHMSALIHYFSYINRSLITKSLR